MNLKLVSIAAGCLFLFATQLFAAQDPQPEVKPLKVLLVGNSQLPNIVGGHLLENLAASDKGGRPITVVGCVKSGSSLKSQWDLGVKPDTARGMIPDGKFDFVVLQEHYRGEAETFQPFARQFHELIKQSGAKTVFFATASILSDYPKGFERLHRINFDMAKELGVPLVDAPHAYIKYFEANPTVDKATLFAADRAHPGLPGSYLYSCIIYSTLTGRSPVGLAAPKEVPHDIVKPLQDIAWAQYQATVEELKK